jgi:hypothetical protein
MNGGFTLPETQLAAGFKAPHGTARKRGKAKLAQESFLDSDAMSQHMKTAMRIGPVAPFHLMLLI